MTRVVHIIKVSGLAGAENHLRLLLPGLRARGIDAHVLYLHPPGNPVDAFHAVLRDADVPVSRMPIARSLDPLMVRRLAAALAPLAPDIVHTHLLHADLYGISAAHVLRPGGRRPRVVSSRHNDDDFRRRASLRALNRRLWRWTDRGIAISDAVRRFCIEVEGARPDQIETIHYGLQPPGADIETLRRAARAGLGLAPDEVIVGFVGRLIPQKGLTIALAAFASIVRAHPQARLVIVGDGPERAALERQAQPLGQQVRFLGWRDDAAALMPAFDVFVMPSLWEGFGLVLLEAMAACLPVVASAVSAIPEVVADGETGLLAPARDVPALARQLEVLLGDATLRRHMGLLGRDRLETHFSPALMIDRTAAVYERVLR